MSRNMSRSSAQTSSRDFREIDRRIEKPKATRDLVPSSSTRRTVVTTLNVHSSVTDCPSKTRSGLEGRNVIFTDSI